MALGDYSGSDILDWSFANRYGAALSEHVAIAPTDSACDPVERELGLSTAAEFAVRRTTAGLAPGRQRAGALFAAGFSSKKLEETT